MDEVSSQELNPSPLHGWQGPSHGAQHLLCVGGHLSRVEIGTQRGLEFKHSKVGVRILVVS